MNKNPYHLGRSITTDWLIIVGFFVVLSAIFVGLAFYQFSIYRQNDRISNRASFVASTSLLLDRAKLGSAVNYLTEREQKFKELKSSPLRFVDPSR